MIIRVDYIPKEGKMFFISVSLNDKESIAFDWTRKAHRVVVQKLVKVKPFPKNISPTLEYDAFLLNGAKIIEKRHIKWLDLGKRDQENKLVWEMTWEKPMPEELAKKFLRYSRLINSNITKLEKISVELKNFENLVRTEIDKVISEVKF